MLMHRVGPLAGLILLAAASAMAAETPPEPLALMKQMDPAMRNFGTGTVEVEQTLPLDGDKVPTTMLWRLKMNNWSDYVETTKFAGVTT